MKSKHSRSKTQVAGRIWLKNLFEEVILNTSIWHQIGHAQSGVSPQDVRSASSFSKEEGKRRRRQGTGDILASLGHLPLLQADAKATATRSGPAPKICSNRRKRTREHAWGYQMGSGGSIARPEGLTYSTRACDAAAAHGHLAVLEWLYNYKSVRWTKAALALALEHGQLPVVRWLHAHADTGNTPPLKQSRARRSKCTKQRNGAAKSARHGCMENNPCGVGRSVGFRFNFRTGALEGAVQRGHLSVLDWCERHGYLLHRRLSPCALVNAAGNGHLDVVEWLVARGKKPRSPDALDSAAAQGHLQVVEWLHWRFGRGVPATTEAMDKAAQAGHLATVEWLHRARQEGCTKRALDGAAQNGHLQVVEWLHTYRREGATLHAMNWAARNGHLKIIEWLHCHRSEGCTTDAMDHAASAGWLNVVEWLHENRNEGCTQNAMNNALQKQLIHIVKWLCKYSNECSLKLAVEHLTKAYDLNKGSMFGNIYPEVSSLRNWLEENQFSW